MKQFTYNGYYFLEVPINSFDFFFLATGNPNLIGYYFNSLGNKKESGNSIKLPPGDYTIIGLSKDLTERQMSEIFDTPANFIAALRSQGLSETNTLILKIK